MKRTGMHPKELFLIPIGGEKYLLYAPLRRAAAVINGSAVEVVSRYIRDEHACLSQTEQKIIDSLVSDNLMGGEEPEHPAFPVDYGFYPYEVTLFLTTRCNLRCLYCYAEGGKKSKDLGWEEAKAAIDFVAENAIKSGRENFIVGFHGGGEPTLAWDMMKACVEYAQEKSRAIGIKADIHTATNGVLSDHQREYILENFTGVNISFDGPADIQNRNRPFANGSGSFDQVMETIKFFDEQRFDYGIRVTITNNSVHRIAETMEFLGTTLPSLNHVHLEPLWYCGRCHTSGEIPPAPEDFIKYYIKGQEAAKELGIQLDYSGARIDTLSNCFCAAPGEGFSVIPGGKVTSCFEVCDTDDPRSEIFHYGYFDPASGQYQFDQAKIQKLRGLSVDNIEFCSDCFCKWHCAGDCLAKSLQDFSPEGHQGSIRCGINRELTLIQLKNMLSEVN